MQLFNKYLLLTWHCVIGFGKDSCLIFTIIGFAITLHYFTVLFLLNYIYKK